ALCACGSAPPPSVPQARIEAEEQRLLAPFLEERTVVADEVTVTLSANFLGSRVGASDIDRVGTPAAQRVGLPGVDRELHERRTERVGGETVETFVNLRGGVERPLLLVVGATRFQALRAIRVRVREAGTMTLDLVATGDVTVLAGSQRLDVPQAEVRDGVWLGR